MKIRIVLADDHEIVREGLRHLLVTEPGFEVVGEAADGRNVVRVAQELQPDLIIMDVGMPHLNGIEATRLLRTKVPYAKILTLSMHATHDTIVEVLKAGASGYVLKEAAFKELIFAIKAVMTNQTYLSPAIADVILRDYLPRVGESTDAAQPHLSPREREILLLLTEGKTTKEIAQHLDINPKTVDRHRQQLMDKLGVRSLAELMKYALRAGLISLDTP
jgi:DNA-binding NarL/FixJ family response regulator